MGFNPLTAERGLKSTTRWLHQGTWLLLLSGAGLIFVVRGSAGRTGVLWILGCALLGLVLSLALRDVLRKLGRRNTEDNLDGAPTGLPVVFDVFPRPETVAFKKDFHAVVAPVKPNWPAPRAELKIAEIARCVIRAPGLPSI
jgi:hypothetical protein